MPNKKQRFATCHPTRKLRTNKLCAPCNRQRLIAEVGHDLFFARERAYRKSYYRANKKSSQHMTYRAALKRKYGLTLEELNGLKQAQNNLCALCNQPERPASDRALAIDHNHKTGKVRKLLCYTCNTLTGRVEKNPELIQKIFAYLAEHEDSK